MVLALSGHKNIGKSIDQRPKAKAKSPKAKAKCKVHGSGIIRARKHCKLHGFRIQSLVKCMVLALPKPEDTVNYKVLAFPKPQNLVKYMVLAFIRAQNIRNTCFWLAEMHAFGIFGIIQVRKHCKNYMVLAFTKPQNLVKSAVFGLIRALKTLENARLWLLMADSWFWLYS